MKDDLRSLKGFAKFGLFLHFVHSSLSFVDFHFFISHPHTKAASADHPQIRRMDGQHSTAQDSQRVVDVNKCLRKILLPLWPSPLVTCGLHKRLTMMSRVAMSKKWECGRVGCWT